MKPIRIFRHLACEGPGYLGDFLDRREVPWDLVCIDESRPVPDDVEDAAGLVFMGAAVGVNDALAWIDDELAFIRKAYAADVPMMGICFGGQLLSKALGGEVTRGDGMEIGWHPLYRSCGEEQADWLDGLPEAFDTFHWHADTFSQPPGSKPLFKSKCFNNQGFVIGDHLAMQFHLEMTVKMVETWIDKYGSDLELDSDCIQSAETIKRDLPERIVRLHEISDILYGKWLEKVLQREVVD